jgi:lysophospholipase L1-like esterase
MVTGQCLSDGARRYAAAVGCVAIASCLLAGGAGAAQAAGAASVAGKVASFEDFDRRARAGEPLSVVFFGGSLTWGANASDPQRTSYRALMGDYLRAKYPKAPLAFHDAAIGGTGSNLGMFRLDRDVQARRPDLVFLDFTANDDHYGKDVPTLAAYECLLREMIGRGIPVVQVLLGFQWNFQPRFDGNSMARYVDHLKLAAAYRTGVGDSFVHIQKCLDDGKATIKDIWPMDGVHPCDRGYELFFQAARDGFERAVADKRACPVPQKAVFSDAFMTRKRIRLLDAPLPAGWRRDMTFRTSMWFDGLSSRWMDDVAVCDAKDSGKVQPLKLEFTGTLVGVFGEADENGLSFKALVDGKLVPYRPDPKKPPEDAWPFSTRRFGAGRLFVWHVLAPALPPGKHTLEIQPIWPAEGGKGQLRIESVCVAGECG